MKVRDFFGKLGNLFASNGVFVAFISGIIVVILAWLLAWISSGLSFSWLGLARLHSSNLVLWIIDICPLAFAVAYYYSTNLRIKDRSIFKEEIRSRDLRRELNANFAREIGAGKLETKYLLEDGDTLGESLLLMRQNLLKNREKEAEQSWIAGGKDLISNILRMHNKLDELSYEVVVNLIQYIRAIQGALYLYDEEKKVLINFSTYAYSRKKYINQEFKIGQGLIGQCAYEKDIIYRTEIPDDYMTITSGILGDQKPRSILIVPLISEENLQGIIEIASLEAEIP